MRASRTSITILLAVIAVTMVFVLVTSISSLALPAKPDVSSIGNPQVLTPTPAETDASQAGSTDGIMWMGIIVAAIVLVPLIASRAMWRKQV